MINLIEVKNLRVSYHTYAGEVRSVQGVDFTVGEGETLAIVGESGCGKTVTAKAVMGLIQPPGEVKEGSEIIYQGRNMVLAPEKEWEAYRGEKCAMIFQDALAALNPTLSVGKQIAENLVIHRKIGKKEAMEEAVRLLEKVGIPEAKKRVRQYPHEFSGGMRQRAMIAIALACSPKLLIADEPTTALDVTIQAQILELLKSLQQETKVSIILITHDLGVVADMADYIAVMYAGKIIEYGKGRDIFYHPRHPYTWSLLNAVPRLDGDRKKELASIEGAPPNLLAPVKGCAFAERCPYCMKVCMRLFPPVFRFGEGHCASCYLHHEKVKGGYPFETGGAVCVDEK
ncbi:MAG: ABC transporter ATP-binding protein [Coprococcus sp.]|nr:ABC transporter ATP-binding protein [Coprococcus sp.]